MYSTLPTDHARLARRRGVEKSLILYSVFFFCSGSTEFSTLDLSGSNAATSSIFLNCHGKRDGYRNGRMSNPAKKNSRILKPDATMPSQKIKPMTYGCHLGYTLPTRSQNKPSEKKDVKEKCHGVQHGKTV